MTGRCKKIHSYLIYQGLLLNPYMGILYIRGLAVVSKDLRSGKGSHPCKQDRRLRTDHAHVLVRLHDLRHNRPFMRQQLM